MPTIFLYGGSFCPPGLHHEAIIRKLANRLGPDDHLIVIPCGPRPDKETTNDLSLAFRAALCDLAFGRIPRVEIDLTDLEHSVFTRSFDIDKRYRALYPNHEICHVIGADIIAGGARGQSEIHRTWFRGQEVWNELQFLVHMRHGVECVPTDLPPHHTVIEPTLRGSSSEIRERIFKHQSIEALVSPAVAAFIERHQLFTGRVTEGAALLKWPFQPIVIADETKPNAQRMAEQIQKAVDLDDPTANCIIVIGGDGFMLRAIRSHWRKRLPFFGINAGTTGFLLNELPLYNVWPHLVVSGELRTYTQPLLFVEYTSEDGVMKTDIAFNDALIERSTTQTAWMRITMNGEIKHERMMGDGFLVSTAAGSTGYARSMGAAPLMIGTQMMVIAGSNICSHQWRAAQLSIKTEIEIEALETAKRPVRAVIDGNDRGSVTRMKVRTSNIASAELAFLRETDLALKISRLQF